MNKVIVTTTINSPTDALIKFSQIKGWDLLIVGDKKTPHSKYKNIGIYLSPEDQDLAYPNLSSAIGWNNIQRRNIGFIYAYEKLNADVIATVDDDNIPLENWPECIIGEEVLIDCYTPFNRIFDPLFNLPFWHRGYPIDKINSRKQIESISKKVTKVFIQAGLWLGDPDIDAISRISIGPNIESYEVYNSTPFGSDKISPFNSQNTFLHRSMLPYYMCIPGVGRMDDIWGSYICQKLTGERPVYTSPSVTQLRNQHNLVTDLEKEIIGYRTGEEMLNWEKTLPSYSLEVFNQYRKLFK